jgi:hypothetical protein
MRISVDRRASGHLKNKKGRSTDSVERPFQMVEGAAHDLNPASNLKLPRNILKNKGFT